MAAGELLPQYQLSCELKSHEADVRAICSIENGMFITGSRDRSVRLWVPKGNGFEVEKLFLGHEHYVSAVLYIPGTAAASWRIASGGHDKKVIVWDVATAAPVHVLTGHTDTISSLALLSNGDIASGSWDKTVRVWRGGACVQTLEGHALAVRALLALPAGELLSASADRTIRLWRDGRTAHTFTGHEDAVMALASLGSLGFASAGNDTLVRVWAYSGECLAQLPGHTGFVFGLAPLLSAQGEIALVSGSDDHSLKVWRGPAVAQTMLQPAVVWAVAVVGPTADVVAACADGVVRVWTRQPAHVASPAALADFNDQLSRRTIAPQQVGQLPGGINAEKLPGPEYLATNQGKRDGENVMIRVGTEVECHQWDQAKHEWVKLGTVTGAAGGANQDAGGMVRGKKYDMVFKVELDEGPARQLGYNRNENPYMAAQRFLWDEDLPQMYLDTVAQFITRNTAPIEIGAGGPALMSDPLTGANRYSPAGTAAPAAYPPAPAAASPSFFPNDDIALFDQFNQKAVHSKLVEFNAALGRNPATQALATNDDGMRHLDALVTATGAGGHGIGPAHLQVLARALTWPNEQLFPVLDLLRALVCHDAAAVVLCFPSAAVAGGWAASALAALRSPQAPNQYLALRVFSNLCRHRFDAARQLLTAVQGTLLDASADLASSTNKFVRLSVATLLLNLAAIWRSRPDQEAKLQATSIVAELLGGENDAETSFRLVVALGTLLHQDEQTRAIARELDTLKPALARLVAVAEPSKLRQAAQQLSSVLV